MPDTIKLGRRPKFPLTITRQYYSALKPLCNELYATTKEILYPELQSIIDEAAALRPTIDRMDSYASRTEDLVARMKEKFGDTYDDAYIKSLVEDFAQRTDEFNFEDFRRTIGASEGFRVPVFETFFQQEFDAFVSENTRLIKNFTDQYYERVQGIVTQGVREGQLNSEITEQIRKTFNLTQNRAKLIARDQVSKYNGSLTQLRQQSVGIERYQWSTSRDERVRPTHRDMEGRIVRWDQPPVITGHPQWDINCRCVAIPVLSFEQSE